MIRSSVVAALRLTRLLTFDPNRSGILLITVVKDALVPVVTVRAIRQARHPAIAPQFHEARRAIEAPAE